MSYLVDLYQVCLFVIFVFLLVRFLLPYVHNYINTLASKRLDVYFRNLAKLDKSKNRLLKSKQKYSNLEIHLSMNKLRANQKLMDLRNELENIYKNKIISYAVRRSREVRNKNLRDIAKILEGKMLNKLTLQSDNQDNMQKSLMLCLKTIREHPKFR